MLTNELFGAHYFSTGKTAIYEADCSQLYFFQSFIGRHEIKVERGDSVYYFDTALTNAIVQKGPCEISSPHLATVVRGYMHPNATMALGGTTTLPYINGCSTKQLFPPLRLGDPTLQYLKIPPYSKEQSHHIHSTSRIVLVLAGSGKSIVGLDGKNLITDLEIGSVCILEPMCPHHFETPTDQPLIAVPLHIYSSIGHQERNHPMFNGTIAI